MRVVRRYVRTHDWPMKALAVLIVAAVVTVGIVIAVVVRDHAPCSFFPAKDAPTRCFQEGAK